MFRPLYRPASGVNFLNKANYTIYNVSVSVNEISFKSINFYRSIKRDLADKTKNIAYRIVCFIIRKCTT